MTELQTWVLIAMLAVATQLIRSVPLLMRSVKPLSVQVTAAVRHAPMCALAALAASDLLFLNGKFAIGVDNPRCLAGVAAAVVCAWTRNILATIVSGIAVYWLVEHAIT